MILFITFGLALFVGLLIQYFLWKSRKKDKNAIKDDWKKFLNASAKNNIGEINYYGGRLIWNKYLKQEQLKLDAFNKQLHYNRTMPEIGSSGGRKQSW